ncbi:MAG: shikimate dehydrogenase [Pseudomonadota bacterium]
MSLYPMLYGIFGHPVSHSLSPAMHNAAFRHLGIDACYAPFDIVDVRGGVEAMRTLGIHGVSVTLPYKIEIMKYLDSFDEQARGIGAVNTVTNKEGVLSGTNTDGIGAIKALGKIGGGMKEKRVVIVGAGGAARAIGYAVKKEGARVIIVNRTKDRGATLAKELGCEFFLLEDIADTGAQVIVNATTMGMHPNINTSPLPAESLKSGMAVMDTVYSPLETHLLKDARAAGCLAICGLDMLVYQGAAQFEIWTGMPAPFDVMWNAAHARVHKEG